MPGAFRSLLRKGRIFFSEEKKQKTFIMMAPVTHGAAVPQAPNHKSLFASFSSEKEVLALILTALACPAQAEDRAALMRAHRGGTLHVSFYNGLGTIDPQISYLLPTLQVYAITMDGLLAFRKTGGDASNDLVPDLAEAMPDVRDAGTTYVFTLRHGVRFSNGTDVTVADVAATFRRLFKVGSPNAQAWFGDIVGAAACLKTPATCTLAGGVETDAAQNTITLHTTRANGDFLSQIALGFTGIMPADTPATDLGTTPPIGTGAYRITQYSPQHGLTLERNPYFRQWSADAQPDGFVDRIDYRFGLTAQNAITAVLNNQLDFLEDQKPLDRLPEIGAKWADRAHINKVLGGYYLTLNVNRPPFNNLAVRRAVALTINRRAAANLFGGPAMATPLCQIAPAGLPGRTPFCPFTKTPGDTWQDPDMQRARALIGTAAANAPPITLITSSSEVARAVGLYTQSVLQDLGFSANLRSLSYNIFFPYIENTNNNVAISVMPWIADYPSIAGYEQILLSCASFNPGSDASPNVPGFCDRAIDARMQAAQTLGATNPAAAAALWGGIDHDLTQTAALIPLFQQNELTLLSSRVGHFMYSNVYHMIFSQAWVQ